MTAADPTPAVERAARFLYPTLGGPNALWEKDNAREALEVALTDPGDPDWLARTLWYQYKTSRGWITTPEAFDNVTSARDRREWRAFADGLRMTLTGEGA